MADRILLALLVVLAACDPGDPYCRPLVEGVAVAGAIGPGTWEQQGIEPAFEALWRRAGTREGEELALPLTVVPGPGGRVAIPDFQLGEVIIVEADGGWRGNVTRSGGGPGEVRHPVAVAWRPDGALVVFDIVGAKLVTLGSEGASVAPDLPVDASFAGPTVARGELEGVALQPSGGTVLVTHAERARADGTFTDERTGFVLRLDPGTGRVDTLVATAHPIVLAPRFGAAPVPGWPRAIAAVGPNGELAVAAADGSYRVIVLDAAGLPVRQICRPVDPLPLERRELGDVADPERGPLAAAFRAARQPAQPASLGKLVLTAEGGVWVQRERPGLFGAPLEAVYGVPGAAWDVYAPDGTFRGTLRAPPDTRIQAVAGDTVWALASGSLDETWLVALRLVTETR